MAQQNTRFVKKTAADYIAESDSDKKTIEVLNTVFDALIAKGCYDPINQLHGYILSEDPTYITNHNNARALICKIERDELLEEMINSYLNN